MNKYPYFMQTESSAPCSPEPNSCPYPDCWRRSRESLQQRGS